MSKAFYWVMLVGITTSCNFYHHQYTEQLKRLDLLLNDAPEAVWDSLQKINIRDYSPAQKAYYYLLTASAADKNPLYPGNDSTLNLALEYYEENPDYYHLARARYYLGKNKQKEKSYKEAYQLFKQAESSLIQSKKEDLRLLGLIYCQLASIQQQQWNLKEAETLCQKSVDLFAASQDTILTIYALEQKGIIQTEAKKFDEAKKNLYKSVEIISTLKSSHTKAYFETKRNLLASISLFYRKTGNIHLAREYNRKCMALFEEYNQKIPSCHFYHTSLIYSALNKPDSAEIFCQHMITAARQENNTPHLINGYRMLALLYEKAGKYREACESNKEYNRLKDSSDRVINQNNALKYNKTKAEKLLLQTKNNRLKACLFIPILLLLGSLTGIFLYNRHKKLKLEYSRLSEIVKHTQWGFMVTKEFITENHIAYDELEKMLNRAKGLNGINTEFYNKFHNALLQQKSSYSGRLFNHLTNSNGSFETKFQQQFPDFHTDDLLLATMIHHQWKLSDMASILHLSLDAIRKRKIRLGNKISTYLKREIDIDEYLKNF